MYTRDDEKEDVLVNEFRDVCMQMTLLVETGNRNDARSLWYR